MSEIVKASSKKCKGGFKPLLKYPAGCARKTEILEQSPERSAKYIDGQRYAGDRYAGGVIYVTRQEAIEVAEAVIKERLADAIKRRDRNIEIGGKIIRSDAYAVKIWGGK